MCFNFHRIDFPLLLEKLIIDGYIMQHAALAIDYGLGLQVLECLMAGSRGQFSSHCQHYGPEYCFRFVKPALSVIC